MQSLLAAACISLFVACCSASVPSVRLNNGIEMPILAFGANIWDANTCTTATSNALRVGIRFIWSSALVGDGCQRAQGEAIKASGIPREEIFVAGTVESSACSTMAGCYEMTLSKAEEQYDVLSEKVLDMLMLDYPPSGGGCPAIKGQWKAFEELYAAKRVRSIAVSNFSPEQLQCILKNSSATVPVANQMMFSVGHGGSSVVEDNAQYDIQMQAYSPLQNGQLANDAACKKIGEAHGKTATQVALRWIVQKHVTICVNSRKLEHLKEDNDIFDFSLSEAEMKQLSRLQSF